MAILRTGLVLCALAIAPVAAIWSSTSQAAEPVDGTYLKSLAAEGKVVLVIEYHDGTQGAVSRKGFASTAGFRAASPNAISIGGRMKLILYGIEPCRGDFVNLTASFAGSCDRFGRRQLQILLDASKVILCRAFASEKGSVDQDVTCFGFSHFPGSLDAVDNFEVQLLSLGAVRLAKKPNGERMRPDLVAAERLGRQGFGMWADPRTRQ